jgi:hypothetical protein
MRPTELHANCKLEEIALEVHAWRGSSKLCLTAAAHAQSNTSEFIISGSNDAFWYTSADSADSELIRNHWTTFFCLLSMAVAEQDWHVDSQGPDDTSPVAHSSP